jgi:hypothetical protein
MTPAGTSEKVAFVMVSPRFSGLAEAGRSSLE